LRVAGDEGTRTAQEPGEGLLVYFGFRLSRVPSDAEASRLLACLETNRPADQGTALAELEGAVLWVAAREVAASVEQLALDALARARARASEALAVARGDAPMPVRDTAAETAQTVRVRVTMTDTFTPAASDRPAATAAAGRADRAPPSAVPAPAPASPPQAPPTRGSPPAPSVADPAPHAGPTRPKGKLIDPD
jgi:hypothetical protein